MSSGRIITVGAKSILSTDKTEVRYTEIEMENSLPKVLFEDENIRLVRN
jgi:hypothetical protein